MTHHATFSRLAAMAWLAASVQAWADPMRPPEGWVEPSKPGSSPPAAPAPQRPNVIVHDAKGAKVAWVNGQAYRVGQSLGGARITRIDRHQMVLDNGKTIQMHEGVRITRYGDKP